MSSAPLPAARSSLATSPVGGTPPARAPENPATDWLPWALSVFGAACAAFVFVKGVLPVRAANADLLQRVARLEAAALQARGEHDSLEQARGQLEERYSSARAQVATALQERERQRIQRQAAQQQLTQTLASAIAAGDLSIEERRDQLVLAVPDRRLFHGDRGEVAWKGRQFLRELAQALRQLPAGLVFQVGAHTERHSAAASGAGRQRTSWELSARRAASVVRFLEEAGGVPGEQLVAAGFSHSRPTAGAAGPADLKGGRVEIVLLPGPS